MKNTLLISIITLSSIFTINAQNVGIGVSNPQSKLDIKGGGNNSSSFGFGVRNSDDKYAFTVRDDGNVGIGTTSPDVSLRIVSPNLGANSATLRIGPTGGNGSSSSQFSLIDMWSTFDNFPTDQGPRRTVSIKAGYDGGVWGNEYVSIHVAGAGDAAVLPTERMRIIGNGNVGIGLTNPFYRLELPNNTSYNIGRARANAWVTYSDGRVKSKRKPLEYGLNEVLKINPYHYYHHNSSNDDDNKIIINEEGELTFGIVAQELHEIIPEMVYKPKNESIDLWSVDYDKFGPILVKAIQEQQAQIESLKSKNKELETVSKEVSILRTELESLKNKLNQNLSK